MCLDQNNIQKSLSCIPIHIASCKKVLVLGGETYFSKLVLLFELAILLSCFPDMFHGKIEFYAKDASVNSMFRLENASCFDPNKEIRLRIFLKSYFGISRFEEAVRDMKSM